MQSILQGMRTLAVTLALGAVPTLATAQSGEEFYDGKTIDYIVATAPGGGFDTYGRLVAEYMQRYLPGSKIVVRNMPGAGHVLGANYIYGADPDGLTIGSFNTGLVYSQLAGAEGVRFDLGEMSWIGKAASDQRAIIVSANSGIETLDQLMSLPQNVKFSADGIGSGSYVETIMLAEAVGVPADIITGYDGNADQLAMMRGEIQGVVAFRSSYEQFVAEDRGRFIALIGGSDPDLPQLGDVASSDQAKEVVALIAAQGTIARVTAGPPGIPEDRLAALRDAYSKALNDPEFRERAAALKLPVEPMIGDEVRDAILTALQQSPATVTLIKSALGN